jgi:hypothetical protein
MYESNYLYSIQMDQNVEIYTEYCLSVAERDIGYLTVESLDLRDERAPHASSSNTHK